ncbi:OprD family outer membrane porin [Oligoflexus tunisiensis]|uniref:OprD family outer membrane porin n=1 Tax=Oligoflexus tunisiensis TaxID=708132 RepID=UPI00114CDA10|nr:OprD family outer membrane porin [Oligoflexus tunisiensis]
MTRPTWIRVGILLLLGLELQALAQQASITTGYFYRRRTDGNLKDPVWPSQEMKSNVINTVFDMSSGYLGGWLKADLGWIAAVNFEKDYRCSEVAFCSKTADSVDGKTNIWAHTDLDGVALNRATLGVQNDLGDMKWKLRAGYDQLNAGVLGTNWGFLFPGTYRGAQLDAQWAGLSFNYAWADAYRTPWATEYGYFQDPGGDRIKEMQTAGLKYQLEGGLYVEGAAGLATGWQKRHFGKLGWKGKVGSSDFSANYQHYRFRVMGADFIGRKDSFGEQNVVSMQLSTPESWTFTLEYVGTQVNFWCAVPEFVPRMSAGYGNSQGRLDYWWNAVSDFNKDGERALNLGIKPPAVKWNLLSIHTGVNVIQAGHISGFNANHERTDREGYERGYNLDLSFSFADGPLKSLSTAVHYTHLKSGGTDLDPNDPGSLYARYGLYSTDDLKVMLVYSTSIL